MNNRKNTILLITFLIFFGFVTFGQKPVITQTPVQSIPPMMVPSGPNQVEWINSDSTVVNSEGNVEKYKLIGNVALRQNTSTLYCNMALLNRTLNTVEAFGNVKIIQSDTVTITGNNATYAGNSRIAKITGNVLLNDQTIKLNTERLDYDLNTHVAYYNNKGKIDDGKSTLTSKEGFYDTVTKIFMFYKNVNILSEDSKITTDSLKYSTLSKEAFFIAPAIIYSKTDTMLVKRGVYNTVSKVSNFYGRSTARTKDYLLTADTLYFDTPTEIGILKGNAEIISKKDSVVLNGNLGKYYGKQGYSAMTGNAILRAIQAKDTLYLVADTLISQENKELKTRKLIAHKNVIIFRKDIQGRCDSLSYSITDSTIAFFKKPILWANGSQSEADSIIIRLIKNKVRIMSLNSKSFVITQDTTRNFNQVKGRQITTYLSENSKIEKVMVVGNGESIYFALDENNKVIGMNRVECSKMNINFNNNKVKRIAFLGKPEATLTPPHELTADKKELDGFKWRNKEKPTLEATILNKIPFYKSEPKTIDIKPINSEKTELVKKNVSNTKKVKNTNK